MSLKSQLDAGKTTSLNLTAQLQEALTGLDFFRELPHAHIDIEEIFGAGDHCIMRWKYSWVDSAGQKGHVRGVDIFREKEGLLAEKFSYVKG